MRRPIYGLRRLLRGDMGGEEETPEFPVASPFAWYRADSLVGVMPVSPQPVDPLDFSSGSWFQNLVTVSTGESDPNGGTDACKIVEDADGPDVHIVAQAPGSEFAVSFIAPIRFGASFKAAERSIVLLLGNNAGSVAIFDLASGEVAGSFGCTPSIVPLGGGWYFCAITFTPQSGTGMGFGVAKGTDPDADVSYVGDGVSGVYAYKAVAYQSLINYWGDLTGNGHDLLAPESSGGFVGPVPAHPTGLRYPGVLRVSGDDEHDWDFLFDGSGMTMIVVWKCSSELDSQYIIDTTSNITKHGAYIGYKGTSKNLGCGITSASAQIVDSLTPAELDTWYLTIFRYEEGATPEWSVLLNNVLTGSGSTTGAPGGGGASDQMVTGVPSSGPPTVAFSGTIHEAVFFDRALTDEETETVYNYALGRYRLGDSDTNPPQPESWEINAGNYFEGDWPHGDQDAIDYVAQQHLLVIGSAGPTAVANLKASNPDLMVIKYHKIAGVKTSDSIYDDCVAAGVIPWLDENGDPCINETNLWDYVDIIDETHRAAWINILLSDLAVSINSDGYDGVFLDNTNVQDPVLSGEISALPVGYTNAAYYSAMAEIMDAIRAEFPGKFVMFNSYRGAADSGFRGVELLDNSDGISFEAFAFQVSGNYWSSVDRYEQQISDFETSCNTAEKKAFALDYGLPTDTQRRLFSLGSFLLVQNSEAFWRYGGRPGLPDMQDYPEYHISIGTPTGSYVRSGSDLFSREYDTGLVVVNPTSGSLNYSLADDMQYLSVTGGGSWPVSGTASWVDITAGTISIPARTAYIMRAPQQAISDEEGWVPQEGGGGGGGGGEITGTWQASAAPLSWDGDDYDDPAFGEMTPGTCLFAVATGGGFTWVNADDTTVNHIPNSGSLPDFDAVLFWTGGSLVTCYMDRALFGAEPHSAAGAQNVLQNTFMVGDAVVNNYKANFFTNNGAGNDYTCSGMTGFENSGAVAVVTGFTSPPTLVHVPA